MTSTRHTLRVALGQRSYDIVIGSNLIGEAGQRLKPLLRRPYVAIVTDANVAGIYLQPLQQSLSASGIESTAIVLPPGEPTKSFTHLATVCDGLLAARIERQDLVIALGGGVIGDLCGFAAAILRRGVGFAQIPTTLLAQVDSSVGGKTGINSQHGKNLIGAFHQPRLVLADIGCIATLSPRERAAGYAEVVKYGLLGDRPFFEWLEMNGKHVLACEEEALRHAVSVSCEAKARIVAEDETETGVRALLNLGHTFGHAYEAATGYSQRLLHGESIAVGMVQAFRFSERLGHCPVGAADRVTAHLQQAGLPTHMSQIPGDLPPPSALLDIMRQDKKAVTGRLTFILLRTIGDAFVAKDVDPALVLQFLEDDKRKQ